MNSGNPKAGSLSPQFNRYLLDLTGMHIKKASNANGCNSGTDRLQSNQ